ncbi:hypothetical protein CLIM01_09661 [Colletotrichum limetticola]|uniref:DUF7708 domain-containing protein n=1 Tax=Colletotrichum limetticola TaxID=1209924 RepID=A0ABQ9PN81_9PEZI|nr:hypothetical protein CLIM01_09661 [Colletotrichum limetticola]
MDTNIAITSWYKGGKQDDGCIAEEAFRAVQKYFQQSGILTLEEKPLVTGSHSMEDLQGLVTATLEKYEAMKVSSTMRKWLERTSEIICHYGTILDVFVQHHPEKELIRQRKSVVNHAETLKIVAKSTWEVGVRLSRVKIVSTIYPTANMRVAVENLYSCILEFLLIAHSWCKESKLRHLVHSFTRPHKLQYDDLLQRISVASDNITELAAVGSQAELRVMHTAHSGKLTSILSALEDAEKSHQQQLDGLTQLVSGLRVSNERQEKRLELIVSLLEASGLTLNDLITKVESRRSLASQSDSRCLQPVRSHSVYPNKRPTRHKSTTFRSPSITRLDHSFADLRGSGKVLQVSPYVPKPQSLRPRRKHLNESVLVIPQTHEMVIKPSFFLGYHKRLLCRAFCDGRLRD